MDDSTARRPSGWDAAVAGQLGGRPVKTREAYERDLGQWAAWCALRGVAPLEATRLDVQAWVDELVDERRPRTVVRKVAAVRGAYRWAVEELLLDRNPAEHVRTPRVDVDDTTAVDLRPEHLVRLVAAARAAGPLELAVVLLLFATGLRVSEPVAADVAGFRPDADPPSLRVRRKGGKVVEVPLSPATVLVLDNYLGARRAGPLLVDPSSGRRLTRFQARRIVIRLAGAAGLPRGVTAHTLRHAYVTRGGDLGVPLEAIQDGAGHADPRTTRHYDRGRRRRAQQGTAAISAWLDDALGPLEAS